MKIGIAAAAALLAAASLPAASQQPATQPEVDLKLFEKAEVDRSKGCTVALWQANRDPDKDRYAYIFSETLTGPNHARQQSRIKIGAQAAPLIRVAVGGKTTGYGLYPFQLYKMAAADDFVILELKLAEEQGEAVEIESGTMTIIVKGKQVFRASVKGGAGCMTPAAPAPRTPTSGQPQRRSEPAPPPGPAMFDKYPVRANLVPREIITAAEKRFSCRPDLMRAGTVGFALSEESAIWEMACDSFAYQASSVYALVHAQMPGKEFRFLEFKPPRGKKRSTDGSVLLNAEWDIRARTVTSISLGRNEGDCGTLERHRVTETGDFQLIEYREKAKCDGAATKPQDWPLVFRGP